MTSVRDPNSTLFRAPELDDRELEVLEQIAALKRSLRFQLHEPRRWSGALRRMALARNIQGSNSIEGYNATLDDAAAVAMGEEPMDATRETQLALEGYRSAMTYVLQLAQEPQLEISEPLIKSLHFMMTSYDLTARPGRWRAGPVFVRDEQTGDIVHEGVEVERVPDLMSALATSMNGDAGDSIVRAAMAHLNLVMIHPFRDGNGRMARCLQSLVLATDGTLAPVFMSVEEYLGRNTRAYYDVLARVGDGSWRPERDARPWLRFTLTAHLRQAQILQSRVHASEKAWGMLEELARERRLPERVVPVLFDAALGYRVRRGTYLGALKDSSEAVSEQTATRDLKSLVATGLLEPHGDKRGRHYTASSMLTSLGKGARWMHSPRNLPDPFADGGEQQPSPSNHEGA